MKISCMCTFKLTRLVGPYWIYICILFYFIIFYTILLYNTVEEDIPHRLLKARLAIIFMIDFTSKDGLSRF